MLNIAKKIYVGWSTGPGISESEVIPFGESTNEKRKIAKAMSSWSSHKEFDNIPLPGFTLSKSSKKSWGSSDTDWLIIDPRGFLARISSKNLEQILHVTGITEGLIQQRCVWARNDSQTQMTLVPVTADNYDKVVSNTKLLDEKIKIGDVQIGDIVLLQNNITGKYMGSLTTYGRITSSYLHKGLYKPEIKLRRQIIEVEPGRYHIQVDTKILKVIDKTSMPMTKEESAKIINDEIAKENAYFTGHDNFPDPIDIKNYIKTHAGSIKFVSPHAVSKPKLIPKEITLGDAEVLFEKFKREKDQSLVLEKNGKHYIIDFPYWADTATSSSFEVEESLTNFNSISVDDKLMGEVINNWQRGRQPNKTHRLDNFTKFYIITKHVKNDTYI